MAKNFFIVIGLAFVLLGLTLNPWTIGEFFSFSGNLEKSSITSIIIIEIIIILVGIVTLLFGNQAYKLRKEILLLMFTCLLIGSISFFLLFNLYQFGWQNAFELDPIRHHKVIPNTKFKLQAPDYKNLTELYLKKGHSFKTVKTNSFGFVSDEIDTDDDSKIRILLLGDSQTEGGSIPESFAKILERKLNDRGGYDKYDIVNGGLGSYSPIIEYNVLKHIGLQFKPKIVILSLDMTDIANDYEYSKSILKKGENDYIFVYRSPWLLGLLGEGIYNKFKLIFSVFKSFSENLELWSARMDNKDAISKIKERVDLKRKNSGNISLSTVYSYSYKNETEFKIHLNLTLYHINKIDKLSKGENITFILHAFPHSPQIFKDYECFRDSMGLEKEKIYPDLIFKELKAFSQKNNITLLLSNDIIKSSKEPPYFYCDMHLNQHGHRLVAEFLFDSIIRYID